MSRPSSGGVAGDEAALAHDSLYNSSKQIFDTFP